MVPWQIVIFGLSIGSAVFAREQCVSVSGRVTCATDPHRHEFIKIYLYDRDVLPWESDDLMGQTKSDEEGNFMVRGCGEDFGWWNDPDPYLLIDHRCPREGRNVAITLRETTVDLDPVFEPEDTFLGVIRLDLNQEQKSYSNILQRR